MFKVLLVEDDSAVLNVLAKLLRIEGLDVTAVETGDQAFEIAARSRDFNVGVFDKVLPGKLNGSELVRAVRSVCPEIGVVQMSGLPNVSSESDNEPCDMVLMKPVRRQELTDAVNYAFQAHSIRSGYSYRATASN